MAYDLGGGSGGNGGITGLSAGLKQLSFESLYLLNFDRSGEQSNFRVSFVGGGTFDIFLKRNFHLGINASFVAKRATLGDGQSTDAGALLTVGVGYSAPIGGGLFVRPGIALGGFVGSRSTDIGSGDADVNGLIYGGAVRAGLNLVFYSGRHFKVHACPEAIVQIGGHSRDDGGGSEFFVSVDSGFVVGISYVFN